jgi:chemotaxis-related protein WspD
MATPDAPPPRDPPVDDERDFVSRLLGREPPPAYLDAWVRTLRDRLGEDERRGRLSVGLFRVGDELFALPTAHVVEVQPLAPIRSVPGRSGDVFRGLVSLRGEILLCASLRALLGLERAADAEADERRFLVVRHGDEQWALVVDAVLDFERFEAASVGGAQVTVSKSAVHFTDGVIQTPAGPAALIDARRLFDGLERSLA